MNKIKEYWFTAQNIAKYKNGMTIAIFFKMLACRLMYGFGPQDYVLFGFYNKPFSEAKTYLKKEELEPIQRQVNKEEHRALVDNKLAFYLHCLAHGLPTPKIIAVVAKSLDSKYQQDITLVDNVTLLKKVLSQEGNDRYLLKPISGSHGSGMLRFKYVDERLINDDGEDFNFSEVDDFVQRGYGYILQRCLSPHKELLPVMPGGSLGTARIVTINVGNQLKIFNPCLRIPLGSNITDNFVHGESRNLATGIDLESGKLLSVYGADAQRLDLVVSLDCHPESHLALKGIEFPCWDEMLATITKAYEAFDNLPTIGWDIALTDEGPCLIEGNWRYDCALLQLAFDKGIKTELPKLLIR